MATSLAQLHKQIAKLEKQAQAVKKKDSVAVIARIKEAIASYDLTPEDLGFGGSASGARSKATPTAKGKGGRTKSRGQYKTGIKYRDDQGHVWSGQGRRPQWYLDAIAAGKTPEQLAA